MENKERTIKKLLRYHLTEEEKEAFLSVWIINGCGGKWGFSFDEFIKREVPYLPNIDTEKVQKLYGDIRELCFEHDFDFWLRGWFWNFTKANYRLTKWVFRLLHWTHFWERFGLTLILFIGLQKKGKKYFYKK